MVILSISLNIKMIDPITSFMIYYLFDLLGYDFMVTINIIINIIIDIFRSNR